MLVNRLPYGLKLKWRDVADRITKTEEREITIEDIDNFVTLRMASQWHHIGTKTNPADNASRGLSAEAIIRSNCWTKGPEFLWLSEENWPHVPVCNRRGDQTEIFRSCCHICNHDLSSRLRRCRSFQVIFVMVLVEEVHGVDTSMQESAAKCCH